MREKYLAVSGLMNEQEGFSINCFVEVKILSIF